MNTAFEDIKIGDVCLVGDGAHASIKRKESGVLYLSSRNFKDGGLDLSKVYYISEEDFNKHFKDTSKAITKTKAGDVALSIIGTIGEPYVVKPSDRFGLSSAVAFLRPDTELVDPGYLYYWLKGPEFQKAVYNVKGGVAQGYVSLEMIKGLPFRKFNKDTQVSIRSFLKNYDNLIENNNRRIAILEEMAQSLYREWFVNFRYPNHEDNFDTGGNLQIVDSPLGQIPNGWEIKSAQAAITINPKTKLDKTTDNPFVGMSGLAENSMVIRDVIQKKGNSGAKFINGDTLFARITPCLQNGKTGYVQFLTEEQPVGFGSTEFIVLRESEDLSSELIYLLSRSNNFREHAIQSMTGATGRQRVHNDCFASLYVAVPPRDLMDEFTTLVAPMFKSIFNLSKRNENLKKQRDMLLPKLISGDIEV
ncbi:restriction endonuclease subunit S [Vibrio lentus]|uniref:restriction endonuclease subunit S n=1 Tax=Vibrio lentus TaxID=136468 RepID=UPI000C845880|nr:restriction endonuclease subunit S [Vibrio lentus]